jgi:hypothetical protein
MGVGILGKTAGSGTGLYAHLSVKPCKWARNPEKVACMRDVLAEPMAVVQALITVATALTYFSTQNPVSRFDVGHLGATFVNNTGNFMAGHAWSFICPVLAFEGMYIAVTNRARHNLYTDIIIARFGKLHFLYNNVKPHLRDKSCPASHIFFSFRVYLYLMPAEQFKNNTMAAFLNCSGARIIVVTGRKPCTQAVNQCILSG